MPEEIENENALEQDTDSSSQKTERRKIPGSLPYTLSPGVLQRVLDKVPVSGKPNVFTSDFLGTVMGSTGGSSRPIIPIFKSVGLLSPTGSPTELYAQFQTEAGRPYAALEALKNGFGEIFKRNQYAHKADEKSLTDIIVSITGLPKTERVAKAILGTFQVFQKYTSSIKDDISPNETQEQKPNNSRQYDDEIAEDRIQTNKLGLSYNINIVLPETTNIEVYNAIFKSISGNLLK